MTQRSANEIEAAIRKAAVGAGWPLGLAEDAGRSARWLAARGFDGVRQCLAALGNEKPVDAFCFSENPDGLSVKDPVSALQLGPSAADRLRAGAEHGQVPHIEAAAVFLPLLCVPPVALAACEGGLPLALEITGENGFRCRVRCIGENIAIDGDLTGLSERASVTFGADGDPETVVMDDPLDRLYRDSLAAGIAVDDAVWREVSVLAARTLVPATEASRNAGAGAGSIDNE